VQAFLAAGHVCSVMGTREYPAIAARHRVPIVVAGFEPLDILDGVRRAVVQLEAGRHELENAYARVVTDAGNEAARTVLAEVFEPCDRRWRGIGTIPASGWRLAEGVLRPNECPAFGRECTPRSPLGAPMVSSEGACAAYFAAGRLASGAESR
jgi:hydrogenase expression/formation protein HypD